MAKLDPFGEIGHAGLNEFSGQIQEDFLRELRGTQGYKRYQEMRLNSPVVGGMLTAIQQAVNKARWEWTSEQGEDDPRLELLNAAMENMTTSFRDHLSEALTMLPFGWSAFEIVYERVGSQVLWRKFAIRGQDTLDHWAFDEDGGLAGLYQVDKNYKLVLIPIEKMVLYRTYTEKNNPEGRSILRTAWIPYYYAKNIQQIEAIGIERDLAGLPVVGLPSAATTEDSDTSDAGKARKLVRNIRNDEQAGVVLPEGWTLTLLSTGGSRQFDTDKIIRRYESRILMSMLAQFILLGQENVGSLALSRDQSDFFNMGVNSVADIVGQAITKYAAPRLLALNGYDADGIKYSHTPVGDVDLMSLADFLSKTGSMITWTPQDEAWLRGVADLPEVDPDELQELRDAQDAERRAMLERFRKPGNKKQDEDEDEDEMGAQFFASEKAKERELSRYERRYQKLVESFLAGEYKRVIQAAKELRRAQSV